MTTGVQAAEAAQKHTKIEKVVKERMDLAAKGELPPNPVAVEMKELNQKLRKIEAKEKCLRVQFLDWLSDKLLDWSNRAHVTASKIESPCIIEVEPRKREDSKSHKESKEIERLKQLLEVERANRK